MPVLFNLFIDYALRIFKQRCHEADINFSIQYRIPNEATNREQRAKAHIRGEYNNIEGGYADDLGIHSWTLEGLQSCVDILHQVLKEFGLSLSKTKTETMVWSWNINIDGPYPDHILNIDDTWITNSKVFKYLGIWNSFDDIHIGPKELDHRINSARCAFAENRNLLRNHSITLATRIRLLNALVRSRLAYGCHAWRPTQSELNKLECTYNRFLRSMIFKGFDRKNPPTSIETDSEEEENIDADWGYVVNNTQLYEIVNTPTISEYFSHQQLKWISHVIRRENSNPCKQLTFHEAKNTRLGRRTTSIINRAVSASGCSRSQFIRNSFLKQL